MQVLAQSPHGNELAIDCAKCHTSESWVVTSKTLTFNHNESTKFNLEGTHSEVNCKECHTTLVFEEVENQCISCHTDIHSASVGDDCARCHTAENWVVNTIPELHEQNGFPLVGEHTNLNCTACHTSETNLRFDNLGNECVNCHQSDFNAAVNPNHILADFSINCTECHSIFDAAWSTGNFNHDAFPLTLGHDIQDCKQCHKTSNFSETSPECITCHQNNFDSSLNPNHTNAGFSTDCITCHTTNPDWTPANWNHDFYPLNGAHAEISEDCVACHKTEQGTYNNAPSACVGCHLNDFNSTTDPNHSQSNFSTDCAYCHTENSWIPSTFNHDAFPLTLGHDISDCTQCHKTFNYADTSSECISCHQDNFDTSINPNHTNAGFSTDCITCHTTNPDWTPANWNHDFYPLNGAHTEISEDCVACHKQEQGAYSNTPSACVGCHLDDFNSTTAPNHSQSNFSTDCTFCHTENSWTPSTFNHDSFPLTLGHDISDCTQCHKTSNYSDTSSECITCHQNDFDTSINPNHKNAEFSTDCITCHTTNPDWTPANWNHDFYPLNGAHAEISEDCVACHKPEHGTYSSTPSACVGCHQSDFNGTTDPNHQNAGFSTECTACHTENSWTPSTFNHDFFPLTLGHDINDCTQCHKTSNYSDTSSECVSCHQSDFNGTTDPNHQNAGFSTECTACHTTGGWTPSTFNHDFFPLTLGHDINDCTQCHKTANYSDTSSECVSCHQSDFNRTTDPNHQNAGFSTECTACHTTGGWTPSTFNHDFFPLTLGHDINDCTQCHKTANYSDTSSECVSCHQSDFNGTTDPNHQNAGFSTECTACHTTGGWTPSTFNHDFFPLTLGHDINDCTQCHKTANYSDTSSECVSCHQSDFNGTTDPNHQNAGFSTECTACHTTGGWTPSTFNHDFFPLTLGHDINDCTQCHKTANYSDTSSECVSCHQSDFNGTTDPNHQNAGFSTECTACHTTGGWTPSTFNHDFFPLTLGHDINDCTQCHKTSNYSDTSSECVSCHQSDFNGTTDPNHQNAGFSTDCAACHTTGNWTPATFDHDSQFFPIYSGKHKGEWDKCIDCHTTNNYSTFSCINCHEHNNKTSVDRDHRGENGYVYESNACYECHPTGRG
ncbi:hypothetical protein [Lutibacter sp.]|uniref:hypothetical protein n=1 Tax=Lutibacter sp. TaxID=1925666 RepID=UPI001A198043|nr:hypothetical protein [Lutibacter sp.]MBI9042692.1 hypothetical protein [Lutibacter sp.]